MRKRLLPMLAACLLLTGCALPNPMDMLSKDKVGDEVENTADEEFVFDEEGEFSFDDEAVDDGGEVVDNTVASVPHEADPQGYFYFDRADETFRAFVDEIHPTGYLDSKGSFMDEWVSPTIQLVAAPMTLEIPPITAYDYAVAAKLLPDVQEGGLLYGKVPSDTDELCQFAGFYDEIACITEVMVHSMRDSATGLVDTEEYAPEWSPLRDQNYFRSEGDCAVVTSGEEDFFGGYNYLYGYNEEFQSMLEMRGCMTVLLDCPDTNWWIIVPNTSSRVGNMINGTTDEGTDFALDTSALIEYLSKETGPQVNLHDQPYWLAPGIEAWALSEDALCSMPQADFDAFVTMYENAKSSDVGAQTTEGILITPEVEEILIRYLGAVPGESSVVDVTPVDSSIDDSGNAMAEESNVDPAEEEPGSATFFTEE